MTGERIASVAEVPPGRTFLFRVEPVDADVEREAILVRTPGVEVGDGTELEELDGGGSGTEEGDSRWSHGEGAPGSHREGGPGGDGDGVAAWLNYCQHFTHVKLDKGGGAPIRNGEVLCTNHGAMFEVDTGLCTHGPCEGAYLNGLGVRVEDDEVYLDDPDYSFVGLGPIEREIGDLSSTSNVEF